MDVNSVMNNYNMNSLWKNLNPSSQSSSIPLVDNVDSAINEDYTASNYFGEDTSDELQDIYKQVEPTYDIPLTYSKSGNLSVPTNTAPPINGLSPKEANILSLFKDDSSLKDAMQNVLSQYDNMESGTLQYNIENALSSNPDTLKSEFANTSSIFSSDPTNIYNTINSLTNASAQGIGNYLNVEV